MEEVDALVHEVLQSRFQPPYSENIIDDVFGVIQTNDAWLARYNALLAEYGQKIKQRIGKTVKAFTGLRTLKSNNQSRHRNSLNSKYSKLGKPD